MGKISFKLPDDFMKKIEQLGDKRGEIIENCLEAAGEVVEKKVKENLYNVLSPAERNGTLINSLGVTSPKIDRNGVYNVKIGFAPDRSDGKNNAMIASVLEYGTKDGRQPPRPFMKPAVRSVQKEAIETIIKTFEKEVKG